MTTPKAAVIKFVGMIDLNSATALAKVIDDKVRQRVPEITLLISSGGGDVNTAITIYNYLKGIPALKVITHNFGVVDSAAAVLYCSGQRRLAVPHAQFLMHGLHWNFLQPTQVTEAQVVEIQNILRVGRGNIAKVIAVTTGKSVSEVDTAMSKSTTLNSDEAVAWGLVHEIKSELFPADSEVISVP
jgi:ATP-dependent protease ClpP protease subunit